MGPFFVRLHPLSGVATVKPASRGLYAPDLAGIPRLAPPEQGVAHPRVGGDNGEPPSPPQAR